MGIEDRTNMSEDYEKSDAIPPFTVNGLQQGSWNNLCGYYVYEFLMEYSKRTP
jgi:hypothetical protein